ncbi:MAG: methyltransferase domain-containing protein [Terriglobia bacterium]
MYFTDPIYRPLLSSKFYDVLYNAEGLTTRLPGENELRDLIATDFAHSDKYFRARIDAIRSLSPSSRLLEIGSSWGYFLHQWNRRQGHAVGIEISDCRRSFGVNKLKVEIVKDFESLGKTRFDVIYTAHSLEHFTDLSTIFPAIYEHLGSNAALVIEVPNFALKEKGAGTLSIIGAVHPLGFSRDFFEAALPKYGLRVCGFFDSWDSFPHRPSRATPNSMLDSIICLARRSGGLQGITASVVNRPTSGGIATC